MCRRLSRPVALGRGSSRDVAIEGDDPIGVEPCTEARMFPRHRPKPDGRDAARLGSRGRDGEAGALWKI